MGWVANCRPDAAINVDRVRWQIEPRQKVLELQLVTEEDLPITLSYLVACFAAVHSRKVKRTVNICVGVGEVKPPTKQYQSLLRRESFRRIGRADEMSLG
jgi:hypothetical protein